MDRTRNRNQRQGERGAALLIAMVLVAVLAVIALGLVNRATNEMQAVGAKRRYDSALSCADGAQALVRSQLQTYGATNATINTVINDASYKTGHYDDLTLVSVNKYIQGTPGASASNPMVAASGDIANGGGTAGGGSGGAQTYQATVRCANTANPGHQIEVDVLFSFGL